MSFIVRSIRENDFDDLLALAKQFTLLNLPADKAVLKTKIDTSLRSFSGELPKEKAEYLFVLEDVDKKRVIGTSLILAKHGTEDCPHYYFKILERSRKSPSLGVGFIHNILRLGESVDGPTEIGGLILDRAYRGHEEKLGRFLSLSRFIYMGMFPEVFEEEVLCELSPPLTEDGRSEFWEALGRRFTGMPYQEADRLTQQHKGFIKTLFPEEDIYMCLLDSKARLSAGSVAKVTEPAKHLLEKMGFKYRKEVDPFDGGPHYGAQRDEITVIKNGQCVDINLDQKQQGEVGLAGLDFGDEFQCIQTRMTCNKEVAIINEVDDSLKDKLKNKRAFCSIF